MLIQKLPYSDERSGTMPQCIGLGWGAQGTQIEATLWNEAADEYYSKLEEGKVYYFSKGKVKPANRAYAAVRNDYTISLDAGCALPSSAHGMRPHVSTQARGHRRYPCLI